MEIKDFYKNFFGFDECYKHQIELWDKINQYKFPLLLKANAGLGKTEAVLAPFLKQFIENKYQIAPRLIYVLPMRVLANNLKNRLEKYTQKISPYISVKLQHGDMPDSPFFTGDIIVTTLDQFVYGFLRSSKQVGHHIDVPAGAVSSSLIVFDEAHMYRDGFTFSIMRAIMEILNHSKIPFVLMTATMPESLEKSLFENIKLSEDQIIVGNDVVKSEIKIEVLGEPLYSSNEVNLSDELLEKIKSKKSIIVLNQVKRAQKVYEEIRKRLGLREEEIVLLHSRFTKNDRSNHENKALSLMPHKEYGKLKIPEGTGIVVSTQVLEAGIDFSAELLLTEIAPADALVQRSGRCARYDGEKGEMIIFPLENDEYRPYEKRHLENTMKWLKEHREFNIKNFIEVSKFINETLDYSATDYEASDTLIDLYECVLYADTKPENIQVRDSKPIKLVVVDFSIGEDRKKEGKIKNAISKTNLRENSLDVDIGVGWMLLKNNKLQYRLSYNFEKKEWELKEIKDIFPFSIYILEKSDYDENMGLKNDQLYII